MTHPICDACETVAHCTNHGCVPITQIRAAEGHMSDKGYMVGNQADYEAFVAKRRQFTGPSGPRHLTFNFPRSMPIKPTHQAAYDFAMATLKQSAGESMLDQALRTLGSDNQIIDLCEPILVAYRKLLTQYIGPELMDWLDWWMYECDHGTKPMEFSIDGVDHDPTTMTLYRFLEIVDAE